MSAYLFALLCFIWPNPHDDGAPYAVPPEFGRLAVEVAELFDNVDPGDTILILVAEHGGKSPYPVDSVGADGEVGLFQTTFGELKDAREHFGVSWSFDDLADPRVAFLVAASAVSIDKHTHATAARCKRPVREPTGELEIGPDGAARPVFRTRARTHNHHAHYRCGYDYRDAIDERGRLRCKTGYRVRLERRFAFVWLLADSPARLFTPAATVLAKFFPFQRVPNRDHDRAFVHSVELEDEGAAFLD